MKSKETFCVPILNNMSHSEETERILEPYKRKRKQSQFIRLAIVSFAIKRGLNDTKLNDMLISTPAKQLKQAIEKERRGHISYGFVSVFYWLLSLSEFKYCSKSQLMRQIIISEHQPKHQQ